MVAAREIVMGGGFDVLRPHARLKRAFSLSVAPGSQHAGAESIDHPIHNSRHLSIHSLKKGHIM